MNKDCFYDFIHLEFEKIENLEYRLTVVEHEIITDDIYNDLY